MAKKKRPPAKPRKKAARDLGQEATRKKAARAPVGDRAARKTAAAAGDAEKGGVTDRSPPAVTDQAVSGQAVTELTLKELAVACGVSERTVNTWIARGCPRAPIEAVKAWQQDNIMPRKGGPRTRGEGRGDESGYSLQQRLNEAKASDAEESAKAKRLKRRLLQRKLMLITEAVREAGEIFTEVRAIIESLPDAIAKEVPQQLRTRIYDVARNKITAAFKKLAALNSVGADRSD